MSPIVKKLLAGFAATKAFEKVQEMRRPRRSILKRNIGKLMRPGRARGAATYLYKNGKLDALTGGGSKTAYRADFPAGPGTQPIPAPDNGRSLEPTGV